MLRQATIPGVRAGKPVNVTVLHSDDEVDGLVEIRVNSGQPIEVRAAELREAIADVLPKGEV